MLKGKKGLYILLPVVVLIWGLIIYRIVDAFSTEEAEVTQLATVKTITLEPIKREKFTIGSVARDPFLGTVYKPITPKNNQKKVSSKKRDTLLWPSINYKGLVTDKATKKAVFVLEINGMTQLIKQKQVVEEVTLIKGNSTTVTVEYRRKRKQVTISN